MNDVGKTFAIARILGNELPPRDIAGHRLRVLEAILRRERRFEDTCRFFVLNRIYDPVYRQKTIDMLSAAGEQWVEVFPENRAYLLAATRRRRVVEAIGINHARNIALHECRARAHFTFVLDGDCFFDEDAWTTTRSALLEDQRQHPHRRFYATPACRVPLDEHPSSDAPLSSEEFMLAFRSDADLEFDERIAFGDDDKNDLLWRLGIFGWDATGSPLCARVGRVLHLRTGPNGVEDELSERMDAREKSIKRLLRDLDSRILRDQRALHRVLRSAGLVVDAAREVRRDGASFLNRVRFALSR